MTAKPGNPFDPSYSQVSSTDPDFVAAPTGSTPDAFALYDDGADEPDVSHWENEPVGTRSEPRFWNPKFYNAYFDITTSDFAVRLFRSFIPYKPLLGWMDDDEEANGGTSVPDLYGPVWITTTLVVALSMGSQIAAFLANVFRKQETDTLKPTIETVQFTRLWHAASVLYFYVFLFPILLTIFQCLFAKRSMTQTSLRAHPIVGSIMVYGYSMTPVVIAAFIATVPVRTVQLSVLSAAFILGAAVIMLNLWRDVSVQHRSLTYFVRLLAVLAHGGVGVVMAYIFFLKS